MKAMIFTEEKKNKLEDLWFIYGNSGSKHTHGNHRFIQEILVDGRIGNNINKLFEKDAKFFGGSTRHSSYKPLTEECKNLVRDILEE